MVRSQAATWAALPSKDGEVYYQGATDVTTAQATEQLDAWRKANGEDAWSELDRWHAARDALGELRVRGIETIRVERRQRLDAALAAALTKARFARPEPQQVQIGTYTQTYASTLRDKAGQAYTVVPGAYPVVADVSANGQRVLEGGIVFRTMREVDGASRTIVRPLSVAQLGQLEQDRRIQLLDGRSASIFGDDPKQTHCQAPACAEAGGRGVFLSASR